MPIGYDRLFYPNPVAEDGSFNNRSQNRSSCLWGSRFIYCLVVNYDKIIRMENFSIPGDRVANCLFLQPSEQTVLLIPHSIIHSSICARPGNQ